MARVEQLKQLLISLPVREVPPAVQAGMDRLAAAVGDQQFTCTDTLPLLEAWRESALDAASMFLVEDHLLDCPRCTLALEQAEQVSVLLRSLPQLTPPDAIAERLAQARQPWWHRWVMPAPAPSLRWGQTLTLAGSLAAAIMLAVLVLHPGQPGTRVAKQPRPRSQAPIIIQTPPDEGGQTMIRPPLTSSDEMASVPDNTPTTSPGEEDLAPRTAPSGTRIIRVADNPFSADGPRMPVTKSLPALLMPVGPSAATPKRSAHAPLMVVPSRSSSESDAEVLPVYTPAEQPVAEEAAAFSARDAIQRLAREDDLASSEESLSDVQIAAAPRRPEATVVAPLENSVQASTADELNRSLSQERRQYANPKLAPIVLHNDRMSARSDGLQILIK